MTFVVVVPFRSDGSHRDAAWRWLANRLEGWHVEVGECPPGPWNKALAVADAVNRTDADILVLHDADVYCSGTADAIEAVELGAPWAMPHHLVHRLNEAATLEVLAGTEPHETTGRAQAPYRGYFGGGIVVVPRSTYLQVPLDPRFEGWGGEDRALAFALATLAGDPVRLDHGLWHLWHPPQPRLSRVVGSKENDRLDRRYRAARNDPQAMRALVDEGRRDGPDQADDTNLRSYPRLPGRRHL